MDAPVGQALPARSVTNWARNHISRLRTCRQYFQTCKLVVLFCRGGRRENLLLIGFQLYSTDDIPHSTDPSLSLSPSLVGLNPGLQSGSLLTSVKSRCLCCGKEVVDDPEVPDDLLTHGVQVRRILFRLGWIVGDTIHLFTIAFSQSYCKSVTTHQSHNPLQS